MARLAVATATTGAVLREERIEAGGVPARLYQPTGASGLLLLGHRGTQSKDHPRFVELGQLLATGTGLAVVCIDAPAHGERAPATGDGQKDLEIMVSTIVGPQDVTVKDWKAVAESLGTIGPPVAYVGFSMGAMLGVATVAAFSSIRAAVFWVAGLPPATAETATLDTNPFAAAAEAAGRAEILMINMADDDLFGPERAISLFNLIGGKNKRLMLWPGDHDTEPPEALDLSIEFVKRYAR